MRRRFMVVAVVAVLGTSGLVALDYTYGPAGGSNPSGTYYDGSPSGACVKDCHDVVPAGTYFDD